MSRLTLFPLALLATYVAAQTTTSCSPLNATCPEDPALGTVYNATYGASTTQLSPYFSFSAGESNVHFGEDGAQLVLSKKGDSVTAESTFYIFWGQVEVIMQAAAGQGIISTFDLLSDDLDEIDLEIMGGNTSFVESNWYGWGNQSQYNAIYHPLDGPQEKMHNYTIVWDKDQLQWIIDGAVVRTVPYDAPGQYPQTPSRLKFGIWAGGDAAAEGTVKWAGGPTDWSKGPFTMTIQSIKVTDGSTNTTSYSYGDQTGSYQSIKAVPGESVAAKQINKLSTTEEAKQHWNGLTNTAKIAIAASVLGTVLLVVIIYTAVCIVQRKKGRAEKAVADRAWDEHQNELKDYRTKMAKGDFAVSYMGHGEKF